METLSRVLVLQFTTNIGTVVAITINDPQTNLQGPTIKTAMENIVSSGAVGEGAAAGEGISLAAIKGAHYAILQKSTLTIQ